MPFGTTADTYGKLLRNQSTSTGVTGTGTGRTRTGATSGRAARGSVPLSNLNYSGASAGRWGADPVGAPPAGSAPAGPAYDPAAAAAATAASGAQARAAAESAPPPPAAPPPGTQAGPGILESWFNQRAQGIDAASRYATKRGLDSLNDRYAAAGMANSGAARQGDADLLANIEAQRAGQLDALAGGASGEHQRRLDSMFGQGLGLAGGQSGINSAYDLSAGQAMSDAIKAALGYFLNKAGVDDKSRQGGINNLLGLGALFA